jgi:hypothetical protein
VSDEPLPLPAFTSWPTFPFEGELRVKQLADPVDVEPPRHGEDPAECTACRAPDSAYIWVSERWRVRALDRPTGLPAVLILESRSHLDMGDLPNLLAAELGVLTVRLERSIRSLDGVARVHVNRWGDGSAHLHVWFLARPTGRLQLRGTFLSLWDDILPRIPEFQWRENLALVAAWLADFGGTALAEPPHIDWQAPAEFNLPSAAEVPDDESPVEETEGDTTVVATDADPDQATGIVADTVALPVGAGSSTDGVTTVVVPTQSDRRAEDGTETVKLATGSAAGDGVDTAAAGADVEDTAAEDSTSDEPAIRGKRKAASETVRLGTRASSSGGETVNLSEVGSGATIRFPATAATGASAGAATSGASTSGAGDNDATTKFATTGGAGNSAATIVFPSGDAMQAAAETEGATVKLPAAAEESNDEHPPGDTRPAPEREAGGDAVASGVKSRLWSKR